METTSFSVIIPVYNGEKYLKACLDSVMQALDERVEVIIVDDGSIDNSLAIAKEYEEKSSQFHVFHIENSGVSTARNVALKQVNNDYIVFLDADDLLDAHCFSNLRRVITKGTEFVLGRSLHSFTNDDMIGKLEHNLSQLSEETDVASMKCAFVSSNDNIGIWAVWRHVYSQMFIKENNLEFDEQYSYGEDMDFLLSALINLKNFAICDDVLTHWRIHTHSTTQQYTLKSVLSHISVLYKWQREFSNSTQLKTDNKQKMVSALVNKQVATLAHVKHLNKTAKTQYFTMFAMYDKYLHMATGKFKLVVQLSQTLGYPFISKVLEKLV